MYVYMSITGAFRAPLVRGPLAIKLLCPCVAYIYIYIYIYMYVCMYVCMYVYIYIYHAYVYGTRARRASSSRSSLV